MEALGGGLFLMSEVLMYSWRICAVQPGVVVGLGGRTRIYPFSGEYRGTSLIGKHLSVGTYGRTIPRAL